MQSKWIYSPDDCGEENVGMKATTGMASSKPSVAIMTGCGNGNLPSLMVI